MNRSLVNEIVRSVKDRGSLAKGELLEAWGLSEDDYRELQRILADHAEVEPRAGGGFAARRRRGRLPDEEDGLPVLLQADWERRSVDRLCELLSHAALEELLDDLLYTLRQVRKEMEGADRRGTKRELAAALVLQHGVDLFAPTAVREGVARAAGVDFPRRWHPGKASASEFVAAAGFPGELAGLPSPVSPPDMEYLEGRLRLEPLTSFQREVQRGLLETLQEPLGRRCLVTLPTGAGKTRVAVESIALWLWDRYDREREISRQGAVLWLAHTEELCEQACACFRQVWDSSETVSPTTLVRFWGGHVPDLTAHRETLRQALQRPSVVVTTPNRLVSLLDGRAQGSEEVREALVAGLGLIVIDEAHRAAASSYRRILSAFVDLPGRPVSVVGLTATPFRMEYLGEDPEEGTRELRELFHRLVEPLRTLGAEPHRVLQGMGVLAEPVFDLIRTPTTIRIPDPPQQLLLTEADLERLDRVLAIRTDNTPRRLVILDRILPLAADPENSILYFGPSVRDAECMAFLLRQRGIPAAVVSGNTRDVTRRHLVAEFKQKSLRVLCNCEVLTTGFDAPQVTHIVMARPTVSRVLYEQIVGRGLRGPRFGGTATCAVVDCEDNYRGDRPPMGYETFRKVWTARVHRARK